jgi:hypothetical protein
MTSFLETLLSEQEELEITELTEERYTNARAKKDRNESVTFFPFPSLVVPNGWEHEAHVYVPTEYQPFEAKLPSGTPFRIMGVLTRVCMGVCRVTLKVENSTGEKQIFRGAVLARRVKPVPFVATDTTEAARLLVARLDAPAAVPIETEPGECARCGATAELRYGYCFACVGPHIYRILDQYMQKKMRP